MQERLKTIFTSKQAKRFYWQTSGGFLALFVIFLNSPEIAEYWFAPILIGAINGITKEINNQAK
jgi:hypothetical protein